MGSDDEDGSAPEVHLLAQPALACVGFCCHILPPYVIYPAASCPQLPSSECAQGHLEDNNSVVVEETHALQTPLKFVCHFWECPCKRKRAPHATAQDPTAGWKYQAFAKPCTTTSGALWPFMPFYSASLPPGGSQREQHISCTCTRAGEPACRAFLLPSTQQPLELYK